MENKPNQINTDVVIVGAGLVGLAAAIAMHEAGFNVALIDGKQPTIVSHSADWDSRIYAISPKNAQWLAQLGVWQTLDFSRTVQMQGMEIWDAQTKTPLELSAADINADGLGFIIEASALMQALLKKVEFLGIQTFFNCTCEQEGLTQAPQNALEKSPQIQLTLNSSAGESFSLQAALLLAADGSQSWVRAQYNFPVKQKAYAHTAVVANFKAQKPHQNIARQWFQQWFQTDAEGKLAVLAWLPLPENNISIVWSAPPALAEELLHLSPEDFSEKVAAAGQHLLGNFTLLNAATYFPLQLQTVASSVQDSVVLLGDAAHVVHPMAGQGVNLGFRDVENLLEILKKKNPYQKINDPQLLKQFARARKVDVAKMVLLTDGLYHLFDHQTSVIKKVSHWGFEATKFKYLKELLVNQAVSM